MTHRSPSDAVASAPVVRSRRSFFAPEVVQISSMDCGVASIVCFLRGCGLHANYERMREACQTDVDGTSIDTLEDIANQVGIDCLQHLVAADSVLAEARPRLPVILVTKTVSDAPHFLVVWRVLGDFWQVMDPARGRRWLRSRELEAELHVHTQRFSHANFREWVETSTFLSALQRGVELLAGRSVAEELIAAALRDPDWTSIGALDAAVRFTNSLKRASGESSPRWLEEVLRRSLARAQEEAEDPKDIPEGFWMIRPLHQGKIIKVSTALFLGSDRPETPYAATADVSEDNSPYLKRALSESEPGLLELLEPLLDSGLRRSLAILAVLAFLYAAVSMVQVLAMRTTLADLTQLTEVGQKIGVVGWLASLFALLFFIRALSAIGERRIGRKLEIRLRVLLFESLPRLDEQFVRSRPTSDLTQRAQTLHFVRDLPAVTIRLLSSGIDLVATLAVIAWMDKTLMLLVGVAAATIAVIGYLSGRKLGEVDRKLQQNSASLLQVFQDALLGVVPLRVHGAEYAIRREHRMRLLNWASAQRQRLIHAAGGNAIQSVVISLLLGGMMLRGFALFPDGTQLVLLMFWILRLPMAAIGILGAVQSFPAYRIAIQRALEPTRGGVRRVYGPPEEHTVYASGMRGVRLRFDNVAVKASGQSLMQDVDLRIEAGEHVAVVGTSGAGKSTLLSLLLGLRSPSEGTVYVDGRPLEGETMHALRRQTAWIDPSVQLWNDTFVANLMYGHDEIVRAMNDVLDAANLMHVLERLPQGFMTRIGSDGTLLSGGEGQRVRVGRALLNRRPRLALFDEPFRGLERATRLQLMLRLRELFCHETMLVVTHDIEHVASFDRVLVVSDGRIVEDGRPETLLRHDSRFRELYEADVRNRTGIWEALRWRHLVVESGKVRDLGVTTQMAKSEP